MNLRHKQFGFGAILAIMVLVIMTGMGAAMLRMSWGNQLAGAQDFLSVRAWQVARAGNEWGLYRALRADWATPATVCDAAGVSDTLNLATETGFSATVTCTSNTFNEGGETLRVYRITSVACPSATCPDNTQSTNVTYVERTRIILATDTNTD